MKIIIQLSVTSRHRRDANELLLKVTLNTPPPPPPPRTPTLSHLLWYINNALQNGFMANR